MLIVPRLSVHTVQEHGYHVLFGIVVEVMDLVSLVEDIGQ
jgi:hypothetical protein